MFSCEYSKIFRDNFFYILWLLLNYASVFRKEFKEKKVSGEITFALINLSHVQIQKPASRSVTLKVFVFLEFYYHKKIETRGPWHLKHWRESPLASL